MKFLENVVSELLDTERDLSEMVLVLPGRRPMVFIRKIFSDRRYEGFLPDFYTVEDLFTEISGSIPIQGISLWLYAYDIYRKAIGDEDFEAFVKWFPTLLKDWDDMMKFSPADTGVLQYMLDEERIRNWSEGLGDEDNVRNRNLSFWKKMNVFLPQLKKKLASDGYATSGMIHEAVMKNAGDFCKNTDRKYCFAGFNAFTPAEEKLVRTLLQHDKALCLFQADEYYIKDERQEAGAFLREHMQWKEFNDYRPFRWIGNDFSKSKDISVFEVSGNITQTKVLPEIFERLEDKNLTGTALVLLDENLLPATLDALGEVGKMNITMGFPLKNLAFSNAVKHIFHIQKQLTKKPGSYYYSDVLQVLESVPEIPANNAVVDRFVREIRERNMVYISYGKLKTMLDGLTYFDLFEREPDSLKFLQKLSDFCFQLKFGVSDDVVFENISHFEKAFKTIVNLSKSYDFEIRMETLEVLINQMIGTETIDFQGEPLEGLQVMGLLETRLLNFKNVIMLSVNEGKLPLGNTQNTYIPFDVRKHFDMHTFLENDSVYAYHFYRLLQDSENVFLLYNGLTSGVNTGEKSRFITQLELESPHEIKEIIVENQSGPVEEKPMTIKKTPVVMQKLQDWKSRVSASHLTSYLRDPVQFYLNYILKTRETAEIEEELSVRNYGNLIHYSLEFLYGSVTGKILKAQDLENLLTHIEEALQHSIAKLHHQPEFYEKGMNFIHKSIASKVLRKIISYDLDLVQKGNILEIIDVERQIEDVVFVIDKETGDKVKFFGYIDRIDRLNGVIRVIDYKTGRAKSLTLQFDEDNVDHLLMIEKYKQAIQLCIYLYYINHYSSYAGQPVEAGIWSFAEAGKGLTALQTENGDYETAMISVRNLILEILNPEIPFTENIHDESYY